MSFTRQDIHTNVRSLVGDFPLFTGDNEIGEAEVDLAIEQAVNRFSRDVPREIIEDEVGDDGKYYPLTNLTSWEHDFSEILAIDYDSRTRVSGDELPGWLSLDEGDWKFYEDASVKYFVFPLLSPDSGTTYRIRYTCRHTLNDADSSTITEQYKIAIIYLSVSELMLIASLHAEKASDPPAGAEFITMRNKGSGYESIAKKYEEKYLMEIGGKTVPAGTANRDFDTIPTFGSGYFFHGSRIT